MSESLGPSNDDIPRDELLVAMLVQNAKARDLVWTRGALYRDEECNARLGYNDKITSCCAMGAKELEDDTSSYFPLYSAFDIVWGNDDPERHPELIGEGGFMIGYGFRCAMTNDFDEEDNDE